MKHDEQPSKKGILYAYTTWKYKAKGIKYDE